MDKTLPTREELVRKLASTFMKLGFAAQYSHVLASDYASSFSQIEQERCAKICEDLICGEHTDFGSGHDSGMRECAEAIRSAGK